MLSADRSLIEPAKTVGEHVHIHNTDILGSHVLGIVYPFLEIDDVTE